MLQPGQISVGADYKIHFAVRAIMFSMSKHRRVVIPGQFPQGGIKLRTLDEIWRSLFLNPPEYPAVVEMLPYRKEVLHKILQLYTRHADWEVLLHCSGREIVYMLGYFTGAEQEKLVNILTVQCKLRRSTHGLGHNDSGFVGQPVSIGTARQANDGDGWW